MTMIAPDAQIEIVAYRWVPEFAQGKVRDLRPRWACEEAGIPYRERLIDVREKPNDYAKEQPWCQVPAMLDGKVHVFESGACLLRLAEKSEILLPRCGQERADAISWLFAAFNSVEPWIFEFVNVAVFARAEEWANLRRPGLDEFIAKRLSPLEKRLGQQDWLCDHFTVADIAMVTVLRPLVGSRNLGEFPAVERYIARGEARPAFEQALADQMAAFKRYSPTD